MVTRGQPISLADLDALAALANAKLAPGTPYSFSAFAGSDKINLPNDITIAAIYDPAAGFTDGQKVTLYLYGYKTIAGRKTYTWQPLLKAFTGQAGSGDFSINASWVNPAANIPDGYIAAIPYPLGGGDWELVWQDLGNVTAFVQDGNFDGWKVDFTLDANNEGTPGDNLPCGHGTWLKTLNDIHNDLFTGLDLFGGHAHTFDDTWLVSGPWCVSAGRSLYARFYSRSTVPAVYSDLSFYFPASQSPAVLYRGAEVVNAYLQMSNPSGDNYALSMTMNLPPGIAAGVFTGRVDFVAKGAGADNFANWGFAAVSGMVPVWSFASTNIGGNAYGILTAEFNGTAVANTVLHITAPAGAAINHYAVYSSISPAAIVNGIVNYGAIATVESDATGIDYGSAIKRADFTTAFLDNFNIQDGLQAFPVEFPSSVLASCDGVFAAKTLQTFGAFTYLDQDLPNYKPSNDPGNPDSRRISAGIAPETPSPQVGNRAALWPFFRDTDFAPFLVGGKALVPSWAWQNSIATPNISSVAFNDSVPANAFFYYSFFMPSGMADVRWYLDNPNLVLYVRANNFPTLLDYDAKVNGANWLDLATAIPGFQTDTTWFYAVYNPTAAQATYSIRIQTLSDLQPPNGTFFNTTKADDGTVVPQYEGISYHFSDPATITANRTPMLGYCVYELTLERNPQETPSGIAIIPSTNADLQVKVGLMRGFGFDTAGVFETLDTFVIPAGQPSLRVSVFWPVTSGSPLAYQCTSPIVARASVNFQPAVNSQSKFIYPLIFDNFIAGEQTQLPSSVTPLINGQPQTLQTFSGQPWYDPNKSMLSFKGGDLRSPILLPISADVYNDLVATLNLLP